MFEHLEFFTVNSCCCCYQTPSSPDASKNDDITCYRTEVRACRRVMCAIKECTHHHATCSTANYYWNRRMCACIVWIHLGCLYDVTLSTAIELDRAMYVYCVQVYWKHFSLKKSAFSRISVTYPRRRTFWLPYAEPGVDASPLNKAKPLHMLIAICNAFTSIYPWYKRFAGGGLTPRRLCSYI